MPFYTTQNYTTVVMDGSNTKIVGHIVDLLNHLAKELGAKATCRQLDSKHPTTIVIDIVMDSDMYDTAQHLIEVRYPALCVFNPPMQ